MSERRFDEFLERKDKPLDEQKTERELLQEKEQQTEAEKSEKKDSE